MTPTAETTNNVFSDGLRMNRVIFHYAGFDRFGRIKVAGNLGTPVHLDEFYTYDALHRLNTLDRGNLNATQTGLDGNPNFTEKWGTVVANNFVLKLDALGNWGEYERDANGDGNLNDEGDVDQTRTHTNKVNEITGISGSWHDPVYDAAGNMTEGPKPGDETTEHHYVYDPGAPGV